MFNEINAPSSFLLKTVIAIFCFQFITHQVYASNLPDLGSSDLVEYDSQTEYSLGRAFTSALYTQYSIYNDLETNAYIRKLGHKLASFTGNNRNYSFYIINDPSINAFAGPDGVIGIHTGLINAAESEDELAAVIAHEISHVTQNHLSRRYEYSATQGSQNSIATILAAILIGIYDPSAGMATLMGGMGYNLQQQLKNSRQHETEADAIGIQLLYKAGYNPHAMGDFFARLSKKSQLNTFKVPEILRTHPVSDSRIAQAENRAQNLKTPTTHKPKSYLEYIKLRLKQTNTETKTGFINPNKKPNQALECYKNTLKAITNHSIGDGCASKYSEKVERFPIFTSVSLEAYTKSNQAITPTTMQQIDKLVRYKMELHPNNIAIPIRYSELLNKYNKTNQAIELLEQASLKVKYKYLMYKELSELYTKLQKESYVYYSLARAYFEIGSLKKSQYFAKRAQEVVKSNNNFLLGKLLILKSNIDNLLKKQDKKETKH